MLRVQNKNFHSKEKSILTLVNFGGSGKDQSKERLLYVFFFGFGHPLQAGVGRPTPSAAETIPNGIVRNINTVVNAAATGAAEGVVVTVICASRDVCGARLVAFENSVVTGQGQPVARGGGGEGNGKVGVVSGYG